MLENTFTVSQLNYTIKNLLEGQKTFQGFTLKGEISNFTKHHTGHLYFALKDESTQIRAIMFAGNARQLTFTPKSGDKVTVTGSINVYPPQGSYSVQVSKMQPEGAGELYQRYLQLKKSLQEIGWFDKVKKEIPKYPKNIGVVTSSTGAVIQDITNTINRRYRLTNIILYPTLVQGAQATESIAKQIKRANEEGIVDVLIVGRGGGSIEDLWAFNEMPTIEAIYNSKIPIIAAIGHESDNTISDLVADLRAPTPTAAAELATPNTTELIKNIKEMYSSIYFKTSNIINQNISNLVHLSERLDQSSPSNKINNYFKNVNHYEQILKSYYIYHLNNKINNIRQIDLKLSNLSPVSKLNTNKDKLKQLEANLEQFYYYKLETSKDRINNLASKIRSPEMLIENHFNSLKKYNQSLNFNFSNSLNYYERLLSYNESILEKVNPDNIMKRGFAIIRDDKGVVTSVKDININDNINVELKDGIIKTKVTKKEER